MTAKTSASTPRPTRCHPTAHTARLATSACLVLLQVAAQAADTSPAQQLERFGVQTATSAQAERGRVFFTSRHGGEWSCASCHANPPTLPGSHASTGKAIDPLAPAANPKRFIDTAKVDKWFLRNCKDVLLRECSAGEKADVLAYLIGLKP
jgi:Domain of unknown function (DUF1924)